MIRRIVGVNDVVSFGMGYRMTTLPREIIGNIGLRLEKGVSALDCYSVVKRRQRCTDPRASGFAVRQ